MYLPLLLASQSSVRKSRPNNARHSQHGSQTVHKVLWRPPANRLGQSPVFGHSNSETQVFSGGGLKAKRAMPLTRRVLLSSSHDTQMPSIIKEEAGLKCPKGAKKQQKSACLLC